MKLPVTDYSINLLKEKIEKSVEYAKANGENENWSIHLSISIFKDGHDVSIEETDEILRKIGYERYIFLNHVNI